jgi:hypothetical protein
MWPISTFQFSPAAFASEPEPRQRLSRDFAMALVTYQISMPRAPNMAPRKG